MAKKKDKHQNKTNAVRIVEAAGIPYEMHEYEAPEGFLDGVSVAKALGGAGIRIQNAGHRRTEPGVLCVRDPCG